MTDPVPLVGIPACRRTIAPHPFHVVGEKYITAISVAAQAQPLLIPPLGQATQVARLLESLDGLLLTGSPSNVEAHHYGGPSFPPETLRDPHRDATTLHLIPTAVDAGVPVLAICRGAQEMNVAFGGTLHQTVQDLPAMLDHREDKQAPLEVQYAPAHEVVLNPEGRLSALASSSHRLQVNSLHSQGVAELGTGLGWEAKAPDGLIEAFRVSEAPDFALAVQWHPEWQVLTNPFSRALFKAFGDACRARARRKQQPGASDHAVYSRVV